MKMSQGSASTCGEHERHPLRVDVDIRLQEEAEDDPVHVLKQKAVEREREQFSIWEQFKILIFWKLDF